MYYRVLFTTRHVIKGKVREKESSALFTTEQAAKTFLNGCRGNKATVHAEIESGFNSKGEKI